MTSTEHDAAQVAGTVASIEAALAIVGNRWSLMILREVFHGVRRFEPLRANLGVSRAVLAARLRDLTAAGLLRATPYREGNSRARNEYRPTRAGVQLLPALIALMEWAERHIDGADDSADILIHRDCGGRVHAVLACDAGHDGVEPDQIDPVRAEDGLDRSS